MVMKHLQVIKKQWRLVGVVAFTEIEIVFQSDY